MTPDDVKRRIAWVEQIRSIADDTATRIVCSLKTCSLLLAIIDAS